MEMKRTHPLIITAAVAVILASGIAIASMTGLLPNSEANSDKQEVAAEQAETKKESAKATSKPAPVKVAAVCKNCGEVTEVRRVVIEGKGSGIGAVAGGVVGGLLGNQVGGGNGRKAMTVLGAAGGAYAGNEIEKNRNASVRYDVVVAFNDGTSGVYAFQNQPNWLPGDRVKVVNGQITSSL